MEPLSDNDFYKELIGYWKNQDILITRRAAAFITTNSILFFVFGAEEIRRFLVVAFGFALILNLLWLLQGLRTRSTYNNMFKELSRLEGFTLNNKNKAKTPPTNTSNLFYWNLVRRPGKNISGTKMFCIYIPILFLAAWIIFYIIAIK